MNCADRKVIYYTTYYGTKHNQQEEALLYLSICQSLHERIMKQHLAQQEHLDPDCGGRPSEVNMQDHDFWDLTDNVAADGMVHFHPIRKVIEAGMGLYITEPELRDDCGGEVDWNYHE